MTEELRLKRKAKYRETNRKWKAKAREARLKTKAEKAKAREARLKKKQTKAEAQEAKLKRKAEREQRRLEGRQGPCRRCGECDVCLLGSGRPCLKASSPFTLSTLNANPLSPKPCTLTAWSEVTSSTAIFLSTFAVWENHLTW